MSTVILLALLGLGVFALSATAQAASKTTATTKKISSTNKLRAAANTLLRYVNKGGSKKSTIRYYQKIIKASPTGLADGQTERRIESILGYNIDWKPKKKVVATTFKPKISPVAKRTTVARKAPKKRVPTEKTAVRVTPETDPVTSLLSLLAGKSAAPKPKPRPKPKPKPKAVSAPKLLPASTVVKPKLPTVPKVPDNVLAADSLNKYLLSGGLERAKVKVYQERMGGLTVDGVPGPLTQKRAETLLKKSLSWPHIVAAHNLKKYYKTDRGRNRDVIKGYQETMGELVVDGLVGPKTKKRYKALTGKVW